MNDLIITESKEITFQSIKQQIEDYAETNKNIVFDYEDKQGNKEARSHVAMLRKAKKPINDIHKREKAGILEAGRKLDAGKKELITLVDGMIDHHAAPLQKIKERQEEEARQEAIKQEIIACWDEAHLANTTFDQDRKIAALEAEKEAERKEKERLEREERLKKQAAEQATLVAKAKAELEREKTALALKRAKEEKLAAEQRAKDAEAKAKKEAEEKAKREIDRINKEAAEAAEKKQKEADLENQKVRHKAILGHFCKFTGEEDAKAILTSIYKRECPYLRIDYINGAWGK